MNVFSVRSKRSTVEMTSDRLLHIRTTLNGPSFLSGSARFRSRSIHSLRERPAPSGKRGERVSAGGIAGNSLSPMSATTFLLVALLLAQSIHSWPPAEALRPSAKRSTVGNRLPASSYRPADVPRNAAACPSPVRSLFAVCDPSLVHIALTLDVEYLRGSIAAVHSVLRHASCPENVFFHFVAAAGSEESFVALTSIVRSVFPRLRFKLYVFDETAVRNLISSSVRSALEQPLNYARNYLAELLEPCVRRVIYLDSDVIVVDDVAKLWQTPLGAAAVAAPEYCHANFTRYFTGSFWQDESLSSVFSGRKPCYFNTGVMVMDLTKWRKSDYRDEIERWMRVQRENRIYELGSLPPFLLVFAGRIARVDHRWNQHGLGGDSIAGSCRDLHPGPVSLLHWSGSGKPWSRLDSGRPCPLDRLWKPYDLFCHAIKSI